ncbi:hypothetical protein KPH14_000822, partial [Odynerus spinipes]
MKACYSSSNSVGKKSGRGVLNNIINKLSIELHIPGYQFCGPGTRLEERLVQGNRGINPLDAACREHDIAYANNKDLSQRHAADKILAKRGNERVTGKDARWGERLAAAASWGEMNVKRKLGMGIQRT